MQKQDLACFACNQQYKKSGFNNNWILLSESYTGIVHFLIIKGEGFYLQSLDQMVIGSKHMIDLSYSNIGSSKLL
jgi:hypothetical protein